VDARHLASTDLDLVSSGLVPIPFRHQCGCGRGFDLRGWSQPRT